MSILTIFIFGWDKYAAHRRYRRVSEKALHRLEFVGGWPGVLIGMHLFAHKRRKAQYYRITYLIVATHLASVALVVFWPTEWTFFGRP